MPSYDHVHFQMQFCLFANSRCGVRVGSRKIEIRNACEVNSRNDGVDPSKLYHLLVSRIDSSNLGDAGTSLRIILDILSKSLEECTSISDHDHLEQQQQPSDCINTDRISMLARSILDDLNLLFWKGSLSHQIVGTKHEYEYEYTSTYSSENGTHLKSKYRLKRSKPSKERPPPCPAPIPVNGHATIQSSLRSVIASNQPIHEYNW